MKIDRPELGKFYPSRAATSSELKKGKKAFQYRYDGMVLVYTHFTGDSASRIARQVVTVHTMPPLGPAPRLKRGVQK